MLGISVALTESDDSKATLLGRDAMKMDSSKKLYIKTTGWASGIGQTTRYLVGMKPLRMSIVAVAALALVSVIGCSSGENEGGASCSDCAAGCCVNGVCTPYSIQTNAFCGSGGAACSACAAGQTCSTLTGDCLDSSGVAVTDTSSYTTSVTCDPACDGTKEQCISGVCQPLVQNTAGTQNCDNCLSPNQCYDGVCLDPVQYCYKTCQGCCDWQNLGLCHPRGAAGTMTDYQCGRYGYAGEVCVPCTSTGLRCNQTLGTCGNNGGGEVRICLASVTLTESHTSLDVSIGIGGADGNWLEKGVNTISEGAYSYVLSGFGSDFCVTTTLEEVKRLHIYVGLRKYEITWQDIFATSFKGASCWVNLEDWDGKDGNFKLGCTTSTVPFSKVHLIMSAAN